MRVTRKDLEFLLSRVNIHLGQSWTLDYNPIYGGYDLLEESYSIYGRVQARELDGFLRGILYGYKQGVKK